MEFIDFEGILKFAIERETEAIESYEDMSLKAELPGIKDLMLELKAEEENHKKLLLDLTPEKISNLKIRDVIDLKISDYLVEEPVDSSMNFQDLLIFAAKKEQKAAELYKNLAERTQSDKVKKLFEFLTEQEKSHKLKLEIKYEEKVLEED